MADNDLPHLEPAPSPDEPDLSPLTTAEALLEVADAIDRFRHSMLALAVVITNKSRSGFPTRLRKQREAAIIRRVLSLAERLRRHEESKATAKDDSQPD